MDKYTSETGEHKSYGVQGDTLGDGVLTSATVRRPHERNNSADTRTQTGTSSKHRVDMCPPTPINRAMRSIGAAAFLEPISTVTPPPRE